MHTTRGDGVTGIKRRRRNLSSDSVRKMTTALGRGRLKRGSRIIYVVTASGLQSDAVAAIFLFTRDSDGNGGSMRINECLDHWIQGSSPTLFFSNDGMKRKVRSTIFISAPYFVLVKSAPHNLNHQDAWDTTKWYQSLALRNFDNEKWSWKSSQNNVLAKLPILKLTREYEIWEKRIKTTLSNEQLKMTSPSTAEEKICKKNDVKARSLLLMALPNEHQLTFDQYVDAQSMFAAIKARFGGNEATKK
ncbi:hypothetical protein Tco_1154795 [Tanacetum coccineum]